MHIISTLKTTLITFNFENFPSLSSNLVAHFLQICSDYVKTSLSCWHISIGDRTCIRLLKFLEVDCFVIIML